MADSTRTRILLLLERSEFTVTELCQATQLPQSTVSRHLRTLTREGWLSQRAEGTSRHYRLSPDLDERALRLWEAVRDDLAGTSAAREDEIRSRSVLTARAERSKAFFSSEAGQWDRLRQELFGGAADLHLLPGLLSGEERVGDLGCGTGQLAQALAPFAREVVAVDRSPEMLDLARTRLEGHSNVEVRHGELENLPLDRSSLDVAILSLVLHYVVDPPRVLAEVARVLSPGGRVLILDMQRHERAVFREEMGHVWLGFTRHDMTGWLEDVELTSVRMVDLPPQAEAGGPLLFALRAVRGEASGPQAPLNPN